MQWDATYHESVFWFHKKVNGEIRTIEEIPEDHKARFSKLFHSLLDAGIYLAPSGYEVGFLSYAHDDSILDRALEIVKKSV